MKTMRSPERTHIQGERERNLYVLSSGKLIVTPPLFGAQALPLLYLNHIMFILVAFTSHSSQPAIVVGIIALITLAITT